MAVTDGLKLPIPELTEAADGPDAFGDLAGAVEDYLLDRILPTGVTHYPAHHWGSGTTFPTTAGGVQPGDTYFHTGLVAPMRFISGTTWRQLAPADVANAAARVAISTNYAALLYNGFRVRQTDTDLIWEWNGGDWRIVSLVRGKMWRTVGFSGAVAAPITQQVAMQQSRVSGGFTFANNALVIPVDGRYDLSFGSYATGGSVGTGAWTVNRIRSGVADATAANAIWYKSQTNVDQWAPHHTSDIPLKAGDALGLFVTLYVGTLAHYGISEGSGSFVTATYAGPLGTAAPI